MNLVLAVLDFTFKGKLKSYLPVTNPSIKPGLKSKLFVLFPQTFSNLIIIICSSKSAKAQKISMDQEINKFENTAISKIWKKNDPILNLFTSIDLFTILIYCVLISSKIYHRKFNTFSYLSIFKIGENFGKSNLSKLLSSGDMHL